MKYVSLRENTYYYRRRIPSKLVPILKTNIIYRSLAQDKKTALQIAKRYDNLFVMLKVSLKLSRDISTIIHDLELNDRPETKAVDVYDMYLRSLDVSELRLSKVKRLISVIKVLLPSLSDVDMTKLDRVRSSLLKLPKGNIAKYKGVSPLKLVKMDIPSEERLTNETVNDYIKTLNSILQFAYERDVIGKQYKVKTLSATSAAREQREALDKDTVTGLLNGARSVQLSSAYKILYLSGMRPSEAYKCKVTTVDGVKCFDLTDRSIPLKTKSSHRLIPVHSSITDPDKMLSDLRSFKIQNLGRQFKKDTGGGSLYSLRHSFATHLADGVEPHIISELLGHAHQGMTLSRYVKGFDVKILQDAVEVL